MKFTLNGDPYELESKDVLTRMRGVTPDQIYEHAVEVGGVLYPVKQVFAGITGRDNSEFTSQRAQDVLRRLGYVDPRRAPRAGVLPGHGQPTEPTWMLELRTNGGGHQEFELSPMQDRKELEAQLAYQVGGGGTYHLRAIHPDALGGEAIFTIAWANVAAASLHERG